MLFYIILYHCMFCYSEYNTLNPQNELTDWGISNKEEFENLGIEECKKYNLKYKSAINNDVY